MALVTFGKTTNGTGSSFASEDFKVASRAIPPSAGQVQTGAVRLWLTAASTSNARMVIYANDGTTATTLLATSDQTVVSNTAEAEVSFTFSGANKIYVYPGTFYSIGVHWSDPGATNINISRDGTLSQTQGSSDTYADGTATTWVNTSNINGPLDAYITYDNAILPPSQGSMLPMFM